MYADASKKLSNDSLQCISADVDNRISRLTLAPEDRVFSILDTTMQLAAFDLSSLETVFMCIIIGSNCPYYGGAVPYLGGSVPPKLSGFLLLSLQPDFNFVSYFDQSLFLTEIHIKFMDFDFVLFVLIL